MPERQTVGHPPGLVPALALISMLAAVVVTLSTTSLVLVGCVAALPFGALMLRAGGRRRLGQRIVSLAPVILGSVVVRVICARGMTPVRWMGVSFMRESLVAGGFTGTRILVAAMWTSWLSVTFTAREIQRALRVIGVPLVLIELLAMTLRFAVQLKVTLTAAWSAAALRAGFSSPRAISRTSGHIAGVLVVRALDRSERVATAITLRGYGHSTIGDRADEQRSAPMMRVLLLAVAALAFWGIRP